MNEWRLHNTKENKKNIHAVLNTVYSNCIETINRVTVEANHYREAGWTSPSSLAAPPTHVREAQDGVEVSQSVALPQDSSYA